jgi:hypothetical protein
VRGADRRTPTCGASYIAGGQESVRGAVEAATTAASSFDRQTHNSDARFIDAATIHQQFDTAAGPSR